MTARLYSNENSPLPVVEALRRRGHDVLTTRDAGKSNEGIPDEDVLAFAIADPRAVLTHNRQDYIRLHRLNPDPEHAGIIACTRDDENPAALALRIHLAMGSVPWLAGQLIRVVRPSS